MVDAVFRSSIGRAAERGFRLAVKPEVRQKTFCNWAGGSLTGTTRPKPSSSMQYSGKQEASRACHSWSNLIFKNHQQKVSCTQDALKLHKAPQDKANIDGIAVVNPITNKYK